MVCVPIIQNAKLETVALEATVEKDVKEKSGSFLRVEKLEAQGITKGGEPHRVSSFRKRKRVDCFSLCGNLEGKNHK